MEVSRALGTLRFAQPEACVVFNGFPPSPHRSPPSFPRCPPVIPAKAGIHNSAPIIKQPTLYIMASKAKETLYTNVTSNLKKRVWEHRTWQLGNSGK